MKITAKISDLQKALTIVNSVIASKSVRNATKYLLFKCAKDGLSICASDMESFVQLHIPATCDESKDVLMPTMLLQLLADRDQEEVEIAVNKNVATIHFGFDMFEMPLCEEIGDFPEPKSADGVDSSCLVSAQELANALIRAPLAMAVDDQRYAIGGAIHVKLAGKQLHVVTTDSKHLLKSAIRAENPKDGWLGTPKSILPAKAAAILARILETQGEGKINIEAYSGAFFASNDAFMFQSCFKDGDYPHYDRIIPKDNAIEVSVSTAEFSKAIARAMPFTGEETFGINMEINKGGMHIRASDAFKGKGAQTIMCEYEGEPFTVRANIHILAAMAKLASGNEKIQMQIKTPAAPILVPLGNGVQYVFVPLNAK